MNKTKINIVAFNTIFRKEVIRILRIWSQTLLPSVITTTLYFVIFGNLIGSRIGEMEGFDYIAFIVPGLIMLSVVTNSFANSISSFFGAKFQKSIEEILVSPVSNNTIIFGYALGSVFRGLVVGIIVTIISMLFTSLNIHNIFVLISVIILTSLMFSIAGILNGIYATKFDDISLVTTFVLTPLIYLGGIFYSIKLLPEFWQVVSLANPLLYMVNAFRYGFLGVSDINIWVAFGILIGFILLFYFWTLYLLNKGYGMRT